MSRSHKNTTAAHTAVQQSSQAIFNLLRGCPPFNQMEPNHLFLLIERAWLSFFAAGEVITSPQAGQPKHWYIIRQGMVEGQQPNPDFPAEIEQFTLSTGDSFPLTALLRERPTETTYTATEDCFCLVLQADDLAHLLKLSAPLHDYAIRGISTFLDDLQQEVQAQAYAQLGTHYSLHHPLSQLAVRDPIRCGPDTALRQVVMMMHTYQVGSIIITDEAKQPLGIFTLRDLRRVIASAEGNPLREPISAFMTPDPICLHPQDSGFDAALIMAQHYIGHIALVQKNELVGVVSERDLFALQRVDLVHLARALRYAPSVQHIQQLRQQIVKLIENMLAHGANAQQITQVITQFNDHITTRCIELILAKHDHPEIQFNWLAFGSEAREEQTLFTDQDNAIIFAARDAQHAEQIRTQLLPIASDINDALDACGMSLCPGRIMASNPQLCLSKQEWFHRFEDIIREPDPRHVLEASIFFDLRILWGPDLGFNALQQHIFQYSAQYPAFLRVLAQAALNYPPPPSQLRTWLAQTTRQFKAELDLKHHVLAPIVDAIRVLSLAHQIPSASTYKRIAALAKQEVISARQAEQWTEAYRYLNLLRLQQHQQQAERQEPLSNRIRINELNTLQQRMLREALRQTRYIQALLKYRYRL